MKESGGFPGGWKLVTVLSNWGARRRRCMLSLFMAQLSPGQAAHDRRSDGAARYEQLILREVQ